MWTPREPDEAEVFDFLETWTRDRASGRELPLAHYLKRFPGHEEAIAREYLARTQTATRGAKDAETQHKTAERDGERHIGPYRLLRELGRGGQGAVWLAEDTRIARKVALKFLPASFALLSADRRRRLQREAEVVSRLEHPSICPVYEARIDGETPYIAMRYVEGETLADAIARARHAEPRDKSSLPLPPKTPLDVRRVLAYFERVARALHAAHEAGVIHRDFKPGNAMVTKDGEPIVLDFGQARDERADLGDQTLSGEVLGTPAYMSPEQVAGHARGIDRRTDVWALGASLYETLTLVRPFHGESVAQLMLSIQSDVPRAPRAINHALDSDLDVVLATALEKDGQRRYASALDFAEDLRRVREYEPIKARPAGPLLVLRRWARRHPALAASIAGVFISLSAGLAWSLYMLERERDALHREQVALGETEKALGRERVALSDAQVALTHALSRHLAERATDLLDEDASASLVLAIEAVEHAPNYQSRAALLAALDACKLAAKLDGDPARLFHDVDVGSNSRIVAAVLEDRTARVYSIDDGRELVRVAASDTELACVALDRECVRFATAAKAEPVRLRSASDGSLLGELDFTCADPQALEFDASGTWLLAADRGGTVVVWNARTSERIASWRATSEIGSARFSPDGRRVLTASQWRLRAGFPRTPTASVWGIENGALAFELRGHSDWIAWSEFSPRGDMLVTASNDCTVRLWSALDGSPIGEPLEHGEPVMCARFSPDQTHLVTGTSAGAASRASLWDLATRKRVDLRGGHRDRIVWVEFNHAGDRIVSLSSDLLMHVWSSCGGRELMRTSVWAPPFEALWTPDDRRLVMLVTAGYQFVWHGENTPDVYSLVGHEAPLYSARFSGDSRLAVTAGADGVARIWSTPSWRDARNTTAPGSVITTLAVDGEHVTHALFDPTSASVLVATREGGLVLFGLDGERRWHSRVVGEPAAVAFGSPTCASVVTSDGIAYVAHVAPLGDAPQPPAVIDDAATCARFTPDGSRIVVGRRDDRAHVYDAATGTHVREFSWQKRDRPGMPSDPGVVDLAVHDDGQRIAVACRDTRIRYFDLDGDNAKEQVLTVFDMQDVALSRDGTRLVATGARGRAALRLQNLEDGRPVNQAEVRHADNLTGAAFNEDGTLLLTASLDGTVLVLRASDGLPVAHLVGHKGPVVDAAFSRGSGPQRVITASADGTARVWPVDPLEPALARKPRELDELEIKREQRLALPLEYRAK